MEKIKWFYLQAALPTSFDKNNEELGNLTYHWLFKMKVTSAALSGYCMGSLKSTLSQQGLLLCKPVHCITRRIHYTKVK